MPKYSDRLNAHYLKRGNKTTVRNLASYNYQISIFCSNYLCLKAFLRTAFPYLTTVVLMAAILTSEFHVSNSITQDAVPEAEFLPNNANLYAKFPEKIAKSAVEVWLFDATAEDGSTAITISFFRDALAAPAGFRIAVNATWADGTVWSSPLVFPHSVVTSDSTDVSKGGVVGSWVSDDGSTHASFEVAADLSTAKVSFNAPEKLVGTLMLNSLGFESLPKTAKEAEAAPGIFWMRPIATADAIVDLTFYVKNEDETITTREMVMGDIERAFGGMDRSWDSKGWMKAASDSVFLRAKSGPYLIQFMLLVGKADQQYPLTATARLYCDGQPVCTPTSVLHPGEQGSEDTSQDSLMVSKLYEGYGLPAPFRHQNLGYQLKFRSKTGRIWLFEDRHHRAWYRKTMGPPGPKAAGASGFIVSITGGSVEEGEKFEGWGYEGQVVLPE